MKNHPFFSLITALLLLILSAQPAFAIGTIPTSGTCGFAINGSFPFIGIQLPGYANLGTQANNTPAGFNYVMTNPSVQASGTLNWLGTINFDTNTIVVNYVSQTATNPNTNGNSTPTYLNAQAQVSVAFSVSGPTFGMYSLDLAGGNGSINIIPVNSGSTILMQQFQSTNPSGKTGVCQF